MSIKIGNQYIFIQKQTGKTIAEIVGYSYNDRDGFLVKYEVISASKSKKFIGEVRTTTHKAFIKYEKLSLSWDELNGLSFNEYQKSIAEVENQKTAPKPNVEKTAPKSSDVIKKIDKAMKEDLINITLDDEAMKKLVLEKMESFKGYVDEILKERAEKVADEVVKKIIG